MATAIPKVKPPSVVVDTPASEVLVTKPVQAPVANPKELQRFLDLWAPVVHALPAVINAIEREAELTRHVEILEDRRKVAMVGLEEDAKFMQEKNTKLGQELAQLALDKKAAATVLKEHQASCQARILEAEKELEAFLANKQASLQAHQAEVANSIAAIEDTVVMARKKAAEAIAALTEEISLLEAKRDVAEQALATIRASLG